MEAWSPPRCRSRRRKRQHPGRPQSECDTRYYSGFNEKPQKFVGTHRYHTPNLARTQGRPYKTIPHTNKAQGSASGRECTEVSWTRILKTQSGGAQSCTPQIERHTSHPQQGWGRQYWVWAQRAHVRSNATTSEPVSQNCVHCLSTPQPLTAWQAAGPGPFTPCMLHLWDLFAREGLLLPNLCTVKNGTNCSVMVKNNHNKHTLRCSLLHRPLPQAGFLLPSQLCWRSPSLSWHFPVW